MQPTLKFLCISGLYIITLPACSTTTLNPMVVIESELGNISIEVDVERAPITATNFLTYVSENRYEDAKFYRVVTQDNQPSNEVRIEVIQGGLFKDEAKERPAIAHETTDVSGIKHLDGTISMARLEPGTASSEFFICIGAQPELDYGGKRNPDGQGFAAFGQVIEGMDVVRAIQDLASDEQYLLTPLSFRVLYVVE